MRRRKRNKYIILLIILLVVSLGYALISTTLKMVGTINLNKHAWNVHWDNIRNQKGADPIQEATISDSGTEGYEDDLITFSVLLNNFGDYYEFTVDAVNEGDFNAAISGIELYCDDQLVPSVVDEEHPSPLPSYASFTIKNTDGTDVTMGEVLAKADKSTNPITPGKKTFKVKIEYTDENMNSSSLDVGENETHTFGFRVNYDYTKNSGSGGGSEEPETRELSLGDYFTLVPDSSTYTALATDTGWSTDQTITPNELTLWRVVGRNNDGTYDAVSEYISSTNINFSGTTGYINYVNVLQNAAAQYQKSGYTVGSRAFGYDGQTLVLDSDELNAVIAANQEYTTPDIKVGTGAEYDGGVKGDTLYLKDTQMVSQFYRTYDYYGVGAHKVNDTEHVGCYLVASRSIDIYPPAEWDIQKNRVVVDERMTLSSINKIVPQGVVTSHIKYNNCGMRPIITIKSNLEIASGTGNKSDPYIFE